ncbi:VOC family protein, partial [Myxococcus sp. AB025B]|uniref:VOC family protein n=1 Tax=Myxococcus sp. AB025B TaxID=2562794 RepID=UPI001890D23A
TTLPRAPLSTLRLGVVDLEAQSAFWTPLAALLGWIIPAPVPADEARYESGSIRLVFQRAKTAATGATLTLEAPSEHAVALIRRQVERTSPGAVLEAGAGRLTFRDPAGLVWEYTTQAG